MAKKIEIEIVGDASKFQKSLGDASKSTSKLGSTFSTFGKAAAVGLAGLGAGAVAAGAKMVGMASDAAEVQSKMEVTFGKTLPGVVQVLDAFSKATGTSRFEMRQQAADMGALLKPMLGSEEAAAAMSVRFVKLATDLGSFNNIPTAEALEKIRAGLVGEAEPLRSLGVLLTEASTKEYAYANGIAKRGAELTEVQKVEARAGQIMQQTALAQGDATRTADSMANQLKALKSSITDTATELGMVLIPYALKAVQAFNDNWPRIKEVAGQVFNALETGITAVVGFFRTHWNTISTVATTAMETIRKVAEVVWPKVRQAAEDVVDWYRANLLPAIRNVISAATAVWEKFGADITRVASIAFKTASAVIGNALKVIQGVINGVLAVIRGDWQEAWENLKQVVSNVFQGIVTLINGFRQIIFTAAVAIGRAIGEGMIAGVKSLAGSVADAARGVAEGAVSSAKRFLGIESPSKVFAGIGADSLRGWILGITEQQPALEGKHKEAAQRALDAAKETVGRYQESFGEAFGKLGDYAKRAFEAKTENLLDNVSKKFDAQIAKWQRYADALTPAEKALAEIDAAEEQRSRDAAARAAQDALTAAQAMEDGVERERAIAAAREQVRQSDLANQRAALQSQAETERAAREKEAAEHIAKLEATKARELQNLEERRRQLGEKLDEQLATLSARLAKHPEEYDKIQKQIQTLLRSYGVPMQKSGELLGKAFAQGLNDAAAEVKKSAKRLAEIVQDYLRLRSPAKKGPLSTIESWWKPMGPMLAKQMGGMAVSGASAGLASQATPAVAGMSGGGGGMNVTLILPNVTDYQQAARAIKNELQRLDRVETGGRTFNSRTVLT